jgi:predicted phosphodiesterase
MSKRLTASAKRYATEANTSADKLHELRAKLKAVEAERDEARKRADQLTEMIEAVRASRVKINLSRRKRGKAGSTTLRIIIPDSHGCYIDQAAASALIADIEQLQPDSIIMLGDHLDCGGFLAEHHTWGYVAETDYNFADDCSAANQFLDAIQSAAPQARIEYLEGNHERRIEKWIVTETVRGGRHFAAQLNAMFSIDSVLHLTKRGIELYRQGVFYDDCRIPGTIVRDGCYFTHGQYTSTNAAKSHLSKYSASVWYGHTHRMQSLIERTVRSGPIGAWNPGCLCILQPLWQHQNITNWSNGYGLQLVEKGMGHLNLTIPVIDGESYIRPLLGRSIAVA